MSKNNTAEAKSLEEIKDEVAQKGGYNSYEAFEDKLTFGGDKEIYIAIHLIDEVAKQQTAALQQEVAALRGERETLEKAYRKLVNYELNQLTEKGYKADFIEKFGNNALDEAGLPSTPKKD